MKSYRVKVLVEIECLVQLHSDPRYESGFDATRSAMANIHEAFRGETSLGLTGVLGSVTVLPCDGSDRRPVCPACHSFHSGEDCATEGTCPCGHRYSQHAWNERGVAGRCLESGCSCERFR